MRQILGGKRAPVLLIVIFLLYLLSLFIIVWRYYHQISGFADKSIYEVILHNNWKYWLEDAGNMQTSFAGFIVWMDKVYLHSKGVFAILVHFGFMGFCLVLMVHTIRDLFSNEENRNRWIPQLLIFSAAIVVFSVLQDSAIVWRFDQQWFAAFFFPIWSYFLLVKYSETGNVKYFYALFIAMGMMPFATPYWFSALSVLLFLGIVLHIGWDKTIIIFVFVLAAYILQRDLVNINDIVKIFDTDNFIMLVHYILNYLGSVFVYVSFEPCMATGSIVGGLFMAGSFVYFVFLLWHQKIKEPGYWVILAFLAFYILSAFANFITMGDKQAILFDNRYLTPSLMAWILIIVLYIHYFKGRRNLQRRIMTLYLTLIAVLFVYQVYTAFSFTKNISRLKLTAAMIHFEENNSALMKDILDATYIMAYHPSDHVSTKMTIFSLNEIKAQLLKEKIASLKEQNPFNDFMENMKKILTHADSNIDVLKGNIDQVKPNDSNRKRYKMFGWIYDTQNSSVPNWLMVFDENSHLIGYVQTGLTREDVQKYYGDNALKSGFIGYLYASKLPTDIMLLSSDGKGLFKANVQ